MEATHALDDMRWEDHDPGTDDRALVKIDSVLIDHADASGRDTFADGPWFDGAVDAVERVFVVLP